MKFEIIECVSGWTVWRDGVEVARFDAQDEALNHVSEQLRGLEGAPASLAMRYLRRTA